MKNIRKIVFWALCIVSLNAKSQASEQRNFEFSSKPPEAKLTKMELENNKAIVLDEFKSREVIFDANDEAQNYLFYHITILVNDLSIIDKLNKVYIPIKSEDQLKTFGCRTIQPGGKTVFFFKGDMKVINEGGNNYFILALEGLEKGSIIEYYYLKEIPVSYYFGESLKNKHYIKKYTSQIVAPSNLVYVSKSYNGLPNAKDTSYNNKNFHTWVMTDLAASPKESYTTDTEKMPRIEIKLDHNTNNSSKKLFTYADAAKKIVTNYHEIESGDEKLVNKVYKNLKLESMPNIDEKVFAIESYIKNDLGYIEFPGNLTMSQCIEKKGLSKFYKNKLAVLLFEKCGINYEVVSTCNKEERFFDPAFESYSFLDVTFFHITDSKKYVIMENAFYRYGEIPSTLTGQKGLFIKPIKIGEVFSALNSVREIVSGDPKKNYSYLECDITFKPIANKLIINTTHTTNGYTAVNTRPYYFYYDEAKRTELLTAILKNGMENAKVSMTSVQNFDLKNYKEYNQPFVCTGLVEANEMLETAGSNFVVKIGNCIGPQAELYQENKREYDLYLGFPHSYRRVIKFAIPEGYTVQGLDKLNMNFDFSENGTVTALFKSSYMISDGKVIITIDESYDKEFYSKANFEDFRKVINAAADFNKISLLLRKV